MHMTGGGVHSARAARLSQALDLCTSGLLDDLRALRCSMNSQSSVVLHLSRFVERLTKPPFEHRVCPKCFLECCNGVLGIRRQPIAIEAPVTNILRVFRNLCISNRIVPLFGAS